MIAPDLDPTLESFGFTPARPGATWRSETGLVLARRDRWLELAGPRVDTTARRGPWKAINGHEVCDLPPCVVDHGLVAEALAWALATRPGSVGEGLADWNPPTDDELRSWVPADALIVRSGPFLARGELVRGKTTLALRFELQGRGDRPEGGRLAWTKALLADAEVRWRLVRFRPATDTNAVFAEVDLFGVPEELAEPMVRAALSGLAWVVGWVLAPLSVLLDGNTRSRALERHLPRSSAITERNLS